MPGKRNRRREPVDWEAASGTDDSSMNPYGHDNSNPVEVGGSERGNNNVYKNNQTDGKKSRQRNAGASSPPSHKASLGPWIQAVGEAAQSVEDTMRKLTNLQPTFKSHTRDLESMDETSLRIQKLEEDCKKKDDELESREKTIDTLTSMKAKAMAKMEREAEQLRKDKIEMEQKKDEEEKKFATMLEQAMEKLTKEFAERTKVQEESYQKRITEHDESYQKRVKEHDETYEKRMQELNDEFAEKRDENDKKASILEAENERLSSEVKERDKKIKAQTTELERIQEQYDVLERAKNSIRQEKQEQEKELERVKKEFALEPKPMAYLYVPDFPLVSERDLC